MKFSFYFHWEKIQEYLGTLHLYRMKLDYLYFIQKECKTRLVQMKHELDANHSATSDCRQRCGEHTLKYITENSIPVNDTPEKELKYILDMTVPLTEFYEKEISIGRECDADDLSGKPLQAAFIGLRVAILWLIREFISAECIAEATDDQICRLFYCTKETDNEKFIRTTFFMLRWLKQDNTLALLLSELRKFKCFPEYHYYKQFEIIFVRADGSPIPDLSPKKYSANTELEENKKILDILKEFERRFFRHD